MGDHASVQWQPIPRVAVSDVAFGRLVDEILSGRLEPGAPVASERELAIAFGVNRHAVREALKRVQQAGLVRISQGGRTRVLDWRRHSGLDVLSALAASGAVPPPRILRDIADLRCTVGADAARCCARDDCAARVEAVVAAASAYPDPGDDGLVDADLAFWAAVVDGSGNLAYRLAFNTLVAAYADIGWPVILRLGAAQEFADRDAHVALAARIAAHDAEGAHRLAEELLGRFAAALAAVPEGDHRWST
jgi:GntR family transcriptional regulator, transcriptional repressor for pyruvate dehydrogenase complex